MSKFLIWMNLVAAQQVPGRSWLGLQVAGGLGKAQRSAMPWGTLVVQTHCWLGSPTPSTALHARKTAAASLPNCRFLFGRLGVSFGFQIFKTLHPESLGSHLVVWKWHSRISLFDLNSAVQRLLYIGRSPADQGERPPTQDEWLLKIKFMDIWKDLSPPTYDDFNPLNHRLQQGSLYNVDSSKFYIC